MRVIEVGPYRNGWKLFESPGVEPFYVGPKAKDHAISYATERLKFSGGEVRIHDAPGAVEKFVHRSDKRDWVQALSRIRF